MHEDVLQSLIDEGLVTDVVHQLKTGKEATVWLCRDSSRLLAAKVYKQRASRAFHNDVSYRAGRAILEDRVARAVVSKTRFGREAAHGMWIRHEYGILRALHRGGADVPEPFAQSDGGILMSFVELEGEPAPQLREARLKSGEVRTVLDRLLWNVELMLADDIVHADLSPFNVLLGDTGPIIIDFPQTVDPRSNPNARALLFRDVENLCRWAARNGVEADGFGIADDLWSRWERAML